MSSPAAVTVDAESVLLLATEPAGDSLGTLTLTMRSERVRTLTGAQLAWNIDHAPRWTYSADYVVNEELAAAWRTGLTEDPDRRVAVPLWPHWILSDDYATRWISAAYWMRTDTAAVVAAASVAGLPSGTAVVPLLFGFLDNEPNLKALAEELGTLSVTVQEDAPLAWAVSLVDQSLSAAAWPTALVPAWATVGEQVRTEFERNALGQGRETVRTGGDSLNAFKQSADFILGDAASVADLLDFFRLQAGMAGVFTAPSWFQPGTVSTYNPTGYSARFASEELELEFFRTGLAEGKVDLVQVPDPTGSATAEMPVYLYKFSYDVPAAASGPVLETLTSHEDSISYDSNTYTPARLEHDSLRRTREFGKETVQVECALGDSAHLLRQWRREHEAPLTLTIYEAYASGSPTPARIFSGIVGEIDLGERVFQARVGETVEADFPRVLVQRADNLAPWSTEQGADPADYDVAATVYDVTGHQLRVTLASDTFATDYFAWGWLELGTGTDYQRRVIVAQTKNGSDPHRTLQLDRPLRGTFTGGESVTLYPGYSGDWEAAQSLFTTGSAYLNFLGFPYVPDDQPEIDNDFGLPGKK
jgi:hypothetical protein